MVKKINDLLISKMLERQGTQFEIILILSNLRNISSPTRRMHDYELRLIEKLEITAKFTETKLIVAYPRSFTSQPQGESAKPIYVHSKVLIVDDRYLSVGSANLATRALRIDTEINLTLEGRTRRDRAHIRLFARKILAHWGLRSVGKPGNAIGKTVHAHEVRSTLLRSERRRERWLVVPPGINQTWVAWQYFFDPIVPWSFPLRRLASRKQARLKKIMASSIRLPALLILSSSAASMGAAMGATRPLWTAAFAAFLGMGWLLPIPFLTTSFFAAWFLNRNDASRAVVFALWACALWSYAFGRLSPATLFRMLRRFHSRNALRVGRKRMGRRTFTDVIKVLFDPRISVSIKLGLLGLFTIPWPWAALASGLLLPSFFVDWIRFWSWVSMRLGSVH